MSKGNGHGLVRLLYVVEVISVLVDSGGAEHVMQPLEAVVVWVVHGGSFVEDGHVAVDHLVVSHEHEGGVED